MLIISCATAAEARAIRKKIRFTGPQPRTGAAVITGSLRGREVALVETGVGPWRAKEAARLIISHLNPSCVVIMGAAGATDPALRLGDIVIIEQILRKEGPIHDTARAGVSSAFCCHAGLNTAAQQILLQSGMRPVFGNCLTAERFVHRKEKKAWIHETFNARVIEMESAAMAALLSAAKIPFINLRVISDTAEKSIIDYEKIISVKKKHGLPGLWLHFSREPRDLLRLMRFRWNTQKVLKTTAAIAEIIAESLPETVPGR
jgi:5'-methylthioadenosine/S-adenosylhomocysteine nucleosidase